MAVVLLFAQAREAAGTKSVQIDGATVGEVLDAAVARLGPEFARILPHCRVWCNGDPAERTDSVTASDEVAVLPPVSGG
jgi:molybdopterin converting factor small subunit